MQSWQILLADLKSAYQQLRDTGAFHFPPKTTSYKQWAERLQAYAQSTQIQAEFPYWLSDARKQAPRLPMHYPDGKNDGASTLMIFALFEPEETETLRRLVIRRAGLQMETILLTAVAQTLTQWSGQRVLHVTVESYGREPGFEDIDLSRTIGPFPLDFPLLINLEHATTPTEILHSVSAQLRAVPNRGLGYSALRYMSKNPSIVAALKGLPQPDISFNYLGSLLLPEVDAFKVDGPYNGRAYTMDRIEAHRTPFLIIGWVADGQLQMSWQYSTNQYRTETVKQLVTTTKEHVRALIRHLAREQGQ